MNAAHKTNTVLGSNFALYDDGGIGDRYTLVDLRTNTSGVHDYFAFNSRPTHPQYGIGMHGEFAKLDMRAFRKRSARKRIALSDLPDTAIPSALAFVRDCDLAHDMSAALVALEKAADTLASGFASRAINAHAFARGIDAINAKLNAALRSAGVKRD